MITVLGYSILLFLGEWICHVAVRRSIMSFPGLGDVATV